MSFDHELKHIKVHSVRFLTNLPLRGENVLSFQQLALSIFNEWSQNNLPQKNKIRTELVGSSWFIIQKSHPLTQHPHIFLRFFIPIVPPKGTPLPVLSCATSLLHRLQGHRKSRLRLHEVLQGSRGHLPNHPVLDHSQCHWRRHGMKCYWSHPSTLKNMSFCLTTSGKIFGWYKFGTSNKNIWGHQLNVFLHCWNMKEFLKQVGGEIQWSRRPSLKHLYQHIKPHHLRTHISHSSWATDGYSTWMEKSESSTKQIQKKKNRRQTMCFRRVWHDTL